MHRIHVPYDSLVSVATQILQGPVTLEGFAATIIKEVFGFCVGVGLFRLQNDITPPIPVRGYPSNIVLACLYLFNAH